MRNYLEISAITNWERVTEELKDTFVDKYFGKDAEVYWIADEVGGCLYINDRFFSLSDIVEFLKYGYSPKKMFNYYDARLRASESGDDAFMNIKSWLKLK